MFKSAAFETEKPAGPLRALVAWQAIDAAADGDVAELRRLLEDDPELFNAQRGYSLPFYFAVRENQVGVVRLLLDSGADPAALGIGGEDLITVARDRNLDEMAQVLEDACSQGGRERPADEDHPIHLASSANKARRVKALLDKEPHLINLVDRAGGTALHRAVEASATKVVKLLLDRGADLHALHGDGHGSAAGYAAAYLQPIDLALWNDHYWGVHGDVRLARMLIDRGADYDLTIAAALGDLDEVKALLDKEPGRIRDARPSGKRPLSSAYQFGHREIVELLLDRGTDPNWPEGPNAPRGSLLHIAARNGDRPTVELLLQHGADPNSGIDSSGSATYAAKTAELRALLFAHGGKLDPYDLIWLNEDDEAVRRVIEDPDSANAGCGGVFTVACTQGKRDLVVRLMDAGEHVPEVLTACRSYVLHDPGILPLLLSSGMNPDLPDWQRATLLHALCGRDGRGRALDHRVQCATMLLDAGATISAKDDDHLSTPLAWAARNDLPDMVEFLLERGAPVNLEDDESWATPLAWATKRGHSHIAKSLRDAGAR